MEGRPFEAVSVFGYEAGFGTGQGVGFEVEDASHSFALFLKFRRLTRLQDWSPTEAFNGHASHLQA